MNNLLNTYRQMFEIRRFEETVMENFSKGVFQGTTHTYIGQEANAVGVISHLAENDIVFSNHRCHGHFLAYGGEMQRLFAEMMGKKSGLCAGRGGSQHIHWKNFYSNGVQGSIVPLAAGAAFAEKVKQTGAVTCVFLGDGTLGEGVVYETLNLASLWGVPLLLVVEDNRIAQTTPLSKALAGSISQRFTAFDIPAHELDTSDVRLISSLAQKSISQIREEQHPQALILHTCRFGPHSKGDDTRPADEVRQMRETRDPLKIYAQDLPETERALIETEVNEKVKTAFEQALNEVY